ncbi:MULTISPECIES: hypothetical protein [unclassified Paenibacillus]|uniref:hypothetical protein n=1 Tax=unclassified Paenibacillus TaxID=185978 RepID=UPI001AE21920|nr:MULTISPECIES: hypothetical protein [unclassified Paenibacillus]MBP1155230.1 hypothetical protein [Paenibacillus sp. PvP091]MBP1169386.1 hypothetical protein [Paenibacillus sp. PvR098]MBP2440414.1 hypothetical protein [Paenibacillus sp. PvP052]
MRIGAFLLGGLAGAAAVVYLSNKNKQMLAGALSSSDSVSHFMNMAGGSSDKTGKSKSSTSQSQSQSFQSSSKDTVNKVNKGRNDDLFKEDGLNKIGDIVNQDPGLKAAVDEILEGNGGKDQYRTH